jgi:uracil-DNA glycosylase
MRAVAVAGLADWKRAARELVSNGVRPDEVQFVSGGQDSLFEAAALNGGTSLKVPRAFAELAEDVAPHRNEARWGLLYAALYRLLHGERHLLEIDVDPVVRELFLMQKAVKRDIHKMHAFVRFRRLEGVEPEEYVAWHRPDHLIVERVGPWFAARFGAMRWAILTPDASVSWNLKELRYGPGVPRSQAPQGDELEALWKTYYGNIFNPARVKVKAMKAEMPVRHWATLPETELIPRLLADAAAREQTMRGVALDSAARFVPAERTLPLLREAVRTCEGCELHRCATQAVWGEGPADAALTIVGEQPGDQEDLAGRPFVGPAGQLLDRAMREAGLARERIYMTNAVKHFKFEERGKRRIHKTPGAKEVAACRPWLAAELECIRPQRIVALGATAALAVAGRQVAVTRERGQWMPLGTGAQLLVTVHPSYLLRLPDSERAQAYEEFVRDLRLAVT